MSFTLLLRTLILAYAVHIYPFEGLNCYTDPQTRLNELLVRQAKVRRFTFYHAPVLNLALLGVATAVKNGTLIPKTKKLIEPAIESLIFSNSLKKNFFLKVF